MMAFLAAVAGMLFGAYSPAPAQTASATATTLMVQSGSGVVTTASSGTVITLVAQVQAGLASVTRGQVKFCDVSVSYCADIHLLGVAQLTSAATATLKFRPGLGTHSYKAVFAGTKTDAGSSSAAVSAINFRPLSET
jgi:hypothetical protein